MLRPDLCHPERSAHGPVGPPNKMKLARAKNEWVAQVSLLRPGFLGRRVNPFTRRNPGLKSETLGHPLNFGAALFSTEAYPDFLHRNCQKRPRMRLSA
jgi:hypothetical protein